jgi:type IV pilus assembly protein PilQ
MILNLLVGSLIFILIPQNSFSESTPFISMDFQNANLKDVLKIFSQQSGLNFIASEDVKDRKLTLYFEKVPVQDAFNTIISANNLAYEQIEGTNIFIVKESEEVKVQTITEIFPLKYARASKFKIEGGGKTETVGIKSAVEKLLSEKGRVAEDLRTNSLVVMDIPSRLKVIEETIAKLDVPTPQVMIEVEMVDATKKVVDSLGIEWSGAFGTYTGPIRETLYPFSQIFPPGPHGWDEATTTTVGKLDMSGLTAALKALTTDTDTKYLARPRILTLSNESAEIKINRSSHPP